MAHIKSTYLGLWKPQDIGLDKINSQMMFIDNINTMESFGKSVKQTIHTPVQTLADLRAIDTSDTTLFTTGMLITVNDVGMYRFNRNHYADDDGNATIAPTVGGGRWVTTQIPDIAASVIEIQSSVELDSQLTTILTNMSLNSVKFFVVRQINGLEPFYGGTVHMTMHKVNNQYSTLTGIIYNEDGVARIYTRVRYNSVWNRWVVTPFLDANGKIPLDQLPTDVLAASIEA